MQYIIIGVMVAVMVVCGIFAAKYSKEQKERREEFLSMHPDAVRIRIATVAGLKTYTINIQAVDGEKPVFDAKGFKPYILVVPGKRKITLTYMMQRPGIIYRTVTETYGPIDYEIDVKTGVDYAFKYDHKEKDVVLIEEDNK
jgi:hypothetical protein